MGVPRNQGFMGVEIVGGDDDTPPQGVAKRLGKLNPPQTTTKRWLDFRSTPPPPNIKKNITAVSSIKI